MTALHPPPLLLAPSPPGSPALNGTFGNLTNGTNASLANLTMSDLAGLEDDAGGELLPFCDEVEEAVVAVAKDAEANATGDKVFVDTTDYCAAPVPEVIDRVVWAEVCGLRLHHGATAVRGPRDDPPHQHHRARLATLPSERPPPNPPPRATWLRLTNASGSIGAAWYGAPLNLSRGFETHFSMTWLDPGAPDGRRAPTFGGGLAFVIQSDSRGFFAVGCSGGGVGFRADPDPAGQCTERIRRGVGVALQADHVDVVRTDVDFLTPRSAAYYPWPLRLDDGARHQVRLRYIAASGGSLTIHVDDMERALLEVTPLDLPREALDEDGTGLAGFTAASGAGAGREVAVEVHTWQLATSEVALDAQAARWPPSSVTPEEEAVYEQAVYTQAVVSAQGDK